MVASCSETVLFSSSILVVSFLISAFKFLTFFRSALFRETMITSIILKTPETTAATTADDKIEFKVSTNDTSQKKFNKIISQGVKKVKKGGGDMNKKAIGLKLKELRGDKTMQEVAKAVGISQSAISMYEHGERVPNDNIKKALAKYFNTTVEKIFFTE